jgi:hypothetical protein
MRSLTADAALFLLDVPLLPKFESPPSSTSTPFTVMLVILPLPFPELSILMVPDEDAILLGGATTTTGPTRELSVTGVVPPRVVTGMIFTVLLPTVPNLNDE